MAAKLIFFGNERLATGVDETGNVFGALIDDPAYEIAALVVSQQDVPARQSRHSRRPDILTIAEQHRIPIFAPQKWDNAALSQLKNYKADIGVLVAYGKIVPDSVIKVFPRGIVNIHPSLLPKHRGSTPIESVILNGETETGVSLIQLVAEMDAGAVYDQQKIVLSGHEMKAELATRLGKLGRDLLLKQLPGILAGTANPVAQNDDAATYDSRIDKAVSELDFHKPAAQLEREIRAYSGWPRSRTKIASTEVIITAAHVVPVSGTSGAIWLHDSQFGLHTRDKTLAIDKLIPVGKKEMLASAFLSGYRI